MAAKKHQPGFIALVDQARAHIDELSVQQVRAMQEADQRFYFLDVREDREFSVDSCAGAMHMGKGVIERDIEAKLPDKDARIVLYCGGGFRSALAADNVQRMGYRAVASMDGGIRAWREAGFPLDTNETE